MTKVIGTRGSEKLGDKVMSSTMTLNSLDIFNEFLELYGEALCNGKFRVISINRNAKCFPENYQNNRSTGSISGREWGKRVS